MAEILLLPQGEEGGEEAEAPLLLLRHLAGGQGGRHTGRAVSHGIHSTDLFHVLNVLPWGGAGVGSSHLAQHLHLRARGLEEGLEEARVAPQHLVPQAGLLAGQEPLHQARKPSQQYTEIARSTSAGSA